MNIQVMRLLISAIDKHQIPESFLEGKTLETREELIKVVKDWTEIQSGVLATEKVNSLQASKDIEAWAAK